MWSQNVATLSRFYEYFLPLGLLIFIVIIFIKFSRLWMLGCNHAVSNGGKRKR